MTIDIHKAIWDKFHIKRRDNLPFTPWAKGTNRNDLAILFAEVGFKRGAEIGVRMGEFSQVLLEENKDLTLLCVDPWAPYARVNQNRQDRYLRYCKQRLAPYGERAVLMKMTSIDALKEVPDSSLDFVYIDGDHCFDAVMIDIICWSNKVKSGGVISGHDLYFFYNGGVVYAVEAYTKAHNINPWYVTPEQYPSFFWVKP